MQNTRKRGRQSPGMQLHPPCAPPTAVMAKVPGEYCPPSQIRKHRRRGGRPIPAAPPGKRLERRFDAFDLRRGEGGVMPEQETLKRARQDEREGKSASTQAGEFVREEMEHVRQGKHGARSPQQAIAIGLSKARRAGVKLAPPSRGKTSAKTRAQAEREYEKGQSGRSHKASSRRSRGVRRALEREGRHAASGAALARHAAASARRRGSADRRRAARQAAKTKGAAGRAQAALRAARTRRTHASP